MSGVRGARGSGPGRVEGADWAYDGECGWSEGGVSGEVGYFAGEVRCFALNDGVWGSEAAKWVQHYASSSDRYLNAGLAKLGVFQIEDGMLRVFSMIIHIQFLQVIVQSPRFPTPPRLHAIKRAIPIPVELLYTIISQPIDRAHQYSQPRPLSPSCRSQNPFSNPFNVPNMFNCFP